MNYKNLICIIGGGGHVGFPLGLMLASKRNFIYLYDKNIITKLNNNNKNILLIYYIR